MVDVCEIPEFSTFRVASLHVLQAPGAADHIAEFPHSRGTRYVLPLELNNLVNAKLTLNRIEIHLKIHTKS